MDVTASQVQSLAETSEPLDVRLTINPPNEATCPLVNRTIDSVRRSSAGHESGTECRLVLGTGKRMSFQTAKIGDQCLCPVFDAHDCVWEMTGANEGTLTFAITVPDRNVLTSLMNSLDDTGATVNLQRITPASAGRDEEMLTSKQREAFLVALEEGYFERPRSASQEEIAKKLDISQGAISKRLNAARQRIAEKYAQQLTD